MHVSGVELLAGCTIGKDAFAGFRNLLSHWQHGLNITKIMYQ